MTSKGNPHPGLHGRYLGHYGEGGTFLKVKHGRPTTRGAVFHPGKDGDGLVEFTERVCAGCRYADHADPRNRQGPAFKGCGPLKTACMLAVGNPRFPTRFVYDKHGLGICRGRKER